MSNNNNVTAQQTLFQSQNMGGKPRRDVPPEQALTVMQTVQPHNQLIEHNNVHMNNSDLTPLSNTASVYMYSNAANVLHNGEFPVLQWYDNYINHLPTFDNYGDLKICALNVCGVISKLELGVFDQFILIYDIICLSETKCKS